jgi:peptidoglycan/LPS O-acetylase OafA/YrhL
MRYRRSIAILAYSVLCAVWVYWDLDQQVFFGKPTAQFFELGVLAGLHVALGIAVARWWALALPILPIVLALPLGYPEANRGEPLPIWFGLLLAAPFAVALIAVGVGGARLVARRPRWS